MCVKEPTMLSTSKIIGWAGGRDVQKSSSRQVCCGGAKEIPVREGDGFGEGREQAAVLALSRPDFAVDFTEVAC